MARAFILTMISLILLYAPSAVCSMDCASLAFCEPTFMAAIFAEKAFAMAKPEASSFAELILRPEESRWSEFDTSLLVVSIVLRICSAFTLVLTFSPMVIPP